MKKLNMQTLIVCGVTAFSAVMVLVSVFLNALKVGGVSAEISMWDFTQHDEALKITLIMISILAAVALIAFVVMMILDAKLMKKKVLEMAMAIAGVVLLIIGIVLFVQIPVFSAGGVKATLDADIGLILNLMFSIVGGIAACVPFVLSLVKKD